MNWEALGAVAELTGAAAVMASLLYVAAQVRASVRASAVEAKLQATRLLTDFLDSFIQSPELNALFIKGRRSLDSLSEDEYLRFTNMSLKAFHYFSAGQFQFWQGTLPESDYFEIRAVLRYWLHGKGCRDWWAKLGRFMYGNEFIAFIESEIAEIDTTEQVAVQEHSRTTEGRGN